MVIHVKGYLRGAAELQQDFNELSRALRGVALRGAMRAAGKVLEKDAKATTNSRRVRASLTTIVQGSADFAKVRIGPKRKTPGARIAHFLEKGTKPHTIRARNKTVLRRGRINFGVEVRHPGGRARPFLFGALDRQRAEVTRKFSSALRQIIEKKRLQVLRKEK